MGERRVQLSHRVTRLSPSLKADAWVRPSGTGLPRTVIELRSQRPLPLLVVVVALGGCSLGGEAQPALPEREPQSALVDTPTGELVEADIDRGPSADAQHVGAAAAANNAFALTLFGETAAGDGNLLFSPLSIAQALTMTYAGAGGDTAEQMAEALALGGLPAESLHDAMNGLGQSPPRSAESKASEERGFSLTVANALWVEDSLGVEQDFLETLTESYGAGVRGLDFSGAPDPSRKRINEWAERETEGRIDELLPSGSIDPLTRLVISNTIHFDAAWEQRFRALGEGAFHRLDGSTEPAELMVRRGPVGFARGEGYDLVEIAYRGGEYSMVVIVPDEGEYERIEAELNPQFLESALAEIDHIERLELTMPRFELRSQLALKDALIALGMVDAFDEHSADFTGMNRDAPEQGLRLSDVFHDAFVKVDEKGTEAAAATGAVTGLISAVPTLRVDRPFLFAIRAQDSAAILFLGRVLEP